MPRTFIIAIRTVRTNMRENSPKSEANLGATGGCKIIIKAEDEEPIGASRAREPGDLFIHVCERKVRGKLVL